MKSQPVGDHLEHMAPTSQPLPAGEQRGSLDSSVDSNALEKAAKKEPAAGVTQNEFDVYGNEETADSEYLVSPSCHRQC